MESNAFCIFWLPSCDDTAGQDMKIYLLMLLIGTLLTAIRFTSTPRRKSEPTQQ
jgi:hypothetical protein